MTASLPLTLRVGIAASLFALLPWTLAPLAEGVEAVLTVLRIAESAEAAGLRPPADFAVHAITR